MTELIRHISATDSTNNTLKAMLMKEKLPEGFLLCTDFQTAGKGQPGNSWESEAGKNVLFTLLLYPHNIPIPQFFLLSKITSLAIKNVLDRYCDDIHIKWPNDIYWKDKKLGGILIENSLMRDRMERSFIGVGLNINQEIFLSDAPNPISLRQITGEEQNRKEIVEALHKELLQCYQQHDPEIIRQQYHENLYRNTGFHPYLDVESGEQFSAKIVEVQSDGKLILEADTGKNRAYYFKEVVFL